MKYILFLLLLFTGCSLYQSENCILVQGERDYLRMKVDSLTIENKRLTFMYETTLKMARKYRREVDSLKKVIERIEK